MNIGGLVPFSTVDFPGKMSAVLFTRGCQYRCKYCHNSQLRKRQGESLPLEKVFSFLEKREGLLEAVTVSGGEPTEQPDLCSFLEELKKFKFTVGLHTNGSHPQVLKEALRHVDWVGLDCKAPKRLYEKVTHFEGSHALFLESLKVLQDSDISFEVRTTVRLPLKTKNLPEMAEELKSYGLREWVVQTGLRRPLSRVLVQRLQDTDFKVSVR